MCIYLSVCGSVHITDGCLRRPDNGGRIRGAELTGSCEPPEWVLEAALGSSTRAVSALNCQGTSLALFF